MGKLHQGKGPVPTKDETVENDHSVPETARAKGMANNVRADKVDLARALIGTLRQSPPIDVDKQKYRERQGKKERDQFHHASADYWYQPPVMVEGIQGLEEYVQIGHGRPSLIFGSKAKVWQKDKVVFPLLLLPLLVLLLLSCAVAVMLFLKGGVILQQGVLFGYTKLVQIRVRIVVDGRGCILLLLLRTRIMIAIPLLFLSSYSLSCLGIAPGCRCGIVKDSTKASQLFQGLVCLDTGLERRLRGKESLLLRRPTAVLQDFLTLLVVKFLEYK